MFENRLCEINSYKIKTISNQSSLCCLHQLLAIDHKVVEQTVTKDSVINIKMVDEGGFVCRIEQVK